MKKKLFIVIAALALVAVLCGTLAACNDTVTDDMFRGGLLIAIDTDGNIGAVNSKGETVIPFSYSMILPFCGEYSYASYDRGDSYGLFLIDKEGNRAEGPEAMLDANGDEPSYTEGYMALRDKKTELWGIMDMNAAKWSVSPVYDKAAIYGNIAVTEMGGVTAVVKCDGTAVASGDDAVAGEDYILLFDSEAEQMKSSVKVISAVDGSISAEVADIDIVGAYGGSEAPGYTVRSVDGGGVETTATRFAGSDYTVTSTGDTGEWVEQVWNNLVLTAGENAEGETVYTIRDIHGKSVLEGVTGAAYVVLTISRADGIDEKIVYAETLDGNGETVAHYIDAVTATEIVLPADTAFGDIELFRDSETEALYGFVQGRVYSLVTDDGSGAHSSSTEVLVENADILEVQGISAGRYLIYGDVRGSHMADLQTSEDIASAGLKGAVLYHPGYAVVINASGQTQGNLSTRLTMYKFGESGLESMFEIDDIAGFYLL